ncbi:hypothetical protein V490_05001 [Pseudogymnoascus sp. VKM F-3557]|nr:hypothetical protein V490_05001 [Pseudogymnoascus sp. VKM F-3557]
MTFLKSATLALAALLPLTNAVPTARAEDGSWDAAHAKAATALAKLSLEDKVKMVTGEGWMKGPCVGTTAEISSIGYPQLCLQDGPLGIRYAQGITAFPAGVQAASTWDIDLINARGNALGTESKAMGVHVQLGPVGGPLGKIPQGGRNWEGFSPDPYLTGVAMAETIKGMQEAGVQACAKHYIGNEQELNRDKMSSTIADRVNHELYLWPFADSVKANVAAVMCSYNRLNGTYACESDLALNGLLKGELDFRGYVVSDWNAQHTTEGSANAGMDMSMPGDNFGDNKFLWGSALTSAVSGGQVDESRVDDMVQRILASWYYLGQDAGYPKVGWSSWNGGVGGPDVQGDHKIVARDIARDGIVLLKNENNALPLKKPASLAIIGQDAINNPDGPNACVDRGCDVGTLAMGWGSGSAEFPYLIAPLDAIQEQATADGTTIVTSTSDSTSEGAAAAGKADTAIVFINADSGEQYITVEGQAGDRADLDPWHNGNGLVEAVANVNKNTIVVIHSVGPLILEKILALPNVVAVVWAGLPGQESGNGLVDILYGSKSPSGKLPYTIAKQASDYGTSPQSGDDNFSEGLYIDYRHFDEAGIEPRYEFGFGLSYTTFEYSELVATYTDKTEGSTTTAPGGAEGLYDTVATVTATITNSGTVEGAEVAQLYITLPSTAPSTPVRQLRGFSKINLAAGESGTVTFSLRRKDLSYWDTDAQKWVTPTGEFTVSVGASSRNLALKGTITMRASILLFLVPFGLAAAAPKKPGIKPLALEMLDSIIVRKQGITVDPSVKTSVIEGGLLLFGIDEVLENLALSQEHKTKYESYLDLVMSGLVPVLKNVTADVTSPLDEFSVGTGFIKQYRKTGNQTLLSTIETLHQTDLLRKRQSDGSYWYYVYSNVTTQDGLFSIPSFHSAYASEFDKDNALTAYQLSALQFSNVIDRCLSHSTGGLLYHGYDPTLSYPIWGNLTSRGHSQSIWGRAVGWTCMGLLITLDVIPDTPATTAVRKQLHGIFVRLMSAIIHAQDESSGAWWQVMNFPSRPGNFLESSATGLFAYAALRGLRLGYLGTVDSWRDAGDRLSAEQYRQSAERAYDWLLNNALLELEDGTLGYNLTVDVCSINSTTAFDFYATQPLKPQSLLGEVGFLLTDLERGLAKK